MDKNQREARRRQEDKAFNRGLLWVGGAIVLELLMLLVNRYYIKFYVSEVETATLVYNILRVVRIAGLAACVICLVWTVLAFRRGGRSGLPAVLTLACGALTVCAHITLAFQQPGVQMLFLLIPAWAGLALVYYLYQREFFLAAAASGLATVGLWFVRYGSGLGLETGLVLAGLAVLLACSLLRRKTEGTVGRGDGQKVRLLPKEARYWAAVVSCLGGLAAVILAAALGASAAYYLIFAMIIWLFGLLVYYTVKLM